MNRRDQAEEKRQNGEPPEGRHGWCASILLVGGFLGCLAVSRSRCCGLVVSWSRGFVVSWSRGLAVSWSRGFVARGFVVSKAFASIQSARPRGFLAARPRHRST